MTAAYSDFPEVPRVDWDAFKRGWRWNRGEHVTIVGPTGAGKTWLMTAILDRHPDVVALNLKPNDETLMERLPPSRWTYVPHWPPPQVYQDRPNWVVLKPKQRKLGENMAHQTRIVRYLFQRIYDGPPGAKEQERGGWTIAIPDLSIILDDLKDGAKDANGKPKQTPAEQLRTIYKHGRGMRISLVIDGQTTAHLERLALDQPSHFFFFRPRDRDRAERMAEIGLGFKREVMAALESLQTCEACRTRSTRTAHLHEVLYVPSNGDMAITVPK